MTTKEETNLESIANWIKPKQSVLGPNRFGEGVVLIDLPDKRCDKCGRRVSAIAISHTCQLNSVEEVH